MNIEVFDGLPTEYHLKSNSKKLFVFDSSVNFELENTFAFEFNAKDLSNLKDSVIQNIIDLKVKSYNFDCVVFLNTIVYGSKIKGLSNVYDMFNELLKFNFDYNNQNGKKWFKIPSYSEIINSEYIHLSHNQDLIYPKSNLSFRPECLSSGLYTTYDLFRNEKKLSFTSKNKYEVGQHLILQFQNQKNYILCRVVLCHDSTILSDKDWSILESYTEEFSQQVDRTGYFQVYVKFISDLDKNGNMIFKEDLFKDVEQSEPIQNSKSQEIPQKNDDISNEQIYKLLLEINSKLDKLLK